MIIRTVELKIGFYINFRDTNKEVLSKYKIPLILQDESEEFKEEINIWKNEFLNRTEVKNYITSLCKSKCKSMNGDIDLGSKGYTLEILNIKEE